MKKKASEVRIPHLKCREIQAPIVSLLIQGFADEVGSDKTLKVAKKVISKDAIESGKKKYDFLRGGERYKYELGAKDLQLYKIEVKV